ncbi:hypothetical protein B0H12DRAFT_1237516 [Mycena haematopus]|nr:hypothetical protein B0H12DRAFT_1237516 [Mycena haematopus]
MAPIPPELIRLIVFEVDDIPSLKACSLAGPIFREPSQRILLRSFRLSQSSNFVGICTLLENSPHVAAYITRLELNLSSTHALVFDFENLQRIFSHLMNVRSCTIYWLKAFQTGDHNSAFPSALLNFLAQQPLRELYLKFCFDIPLAVIARLLTTAPVLSFIHNLVLKYSSEIYELLVRSQFKPYTRALRSFSMFAKFDPNSRLVYETADTLEYIAFDLERLEAPGTILVPSLPRLRSVEFSLPFRSHAAPWFLRFVVALLDASHQLVDVKLSFSPLSIENEDDSPPHIIDTKLMSALDDASASHSACQAIRWCFTLDHEESRDRVIDSAAAVLRRGMPKLHQKGYLVVEALYGPETALGSMYDIS